MKEVGYFMKQQQERVIPTTWGWLHESCSIKQSSGNLLEVSQGLEEDEEEEAEEREREKCWREIVCKELFNLFHTYSIYSKGENDIPTCGYLQLYPYAHIPLHNCILIYSLVHQHSPLSWYVNIVHTRLANNPTKTKTTQIFNEHIGQLAFSLHEGNIYLFGL